MLEEKKTNWKHFHRTLIGLAVISLIAYFLNSPIANKLNKSSLTAVAEVSSVDGRWITYNFQYENQTYSSTFKVIKSHWDSLRIGDKVFVRFYNLEPEINYSIYPDHKVPNALQKNDIIDSLNTEELSWWWLANKPI